MQKLKKKNLYLGNAPDTFLGGGGQLSRKIIDSGLLGDIKLGNFIYATPGLESWHPNPEPWFQKGVGGPIIDMCPYFYTMLINLIGPAKNIMSFSTSVQNEREIGENLICADRKSERRQFGICVQYLALSEA